jgi:hypothetical protein
MNRDPENKECQRDPIFLLQRRIYTMIHCPGWLAYDGENFWIEYKNLDGINTNDWDFINKGEIDKSLLLAYLAQAEIEPDVKSVIESWVTESVWLTRTEAESFAESTKHRYSDGYRVYCVSACGDLAKILDVIACPIT